MEEIHQHPVIIGGTQKLRNGKSHPFCIICRQNVAEVSGRHRNIHRLAGLQHLLLHKLAVGIDVINDLRYQPADIDGVGGREAIPAPSQSFLKLGIVKHGFYTVLGIVKISADADNCRVVTLLGHHLPLLNPAYAILRIKYDNPGMRHIRKAGQCSLSGVARGRRQNDDVLLHRIFSRCRGHQVRQNRQGHVLKCNGGPVEQLHIVSAVRFLETNNLRNIKLRIIGTGNTLLQFLSCKIGQKCFHYGQGRFRIGQVG